MADSDNSRTLPTVTRRRLLSASAVWLATQAGKVDASLARGGDVSAKRDPVLALWRQWMMAYETVERLSEVQQRIESRMLSEVPFPRVDIVVVDRPTVSAFSAEEVDMVFADRPDPAGARAQAKRILADRQRRWDAADEKLGYTRAKIAEARTWAECEAYANALWAEPARSLSGVAAKLHAVLCMGREDYPDDEFPWRQVSSVLVDIVTMGGG